MRRKALVYSTAASHPQNAGNRSRIYHLLLALEGLGVDFRYIYLSEKFQPQDVNIALMKARWGDRFSNPIYSESYNKTMRLATIGSETDHSSLLDDWFDDRLFEQLDSIIGNFKADVVFTDYAVTTKIFSRFDSSVLRILNTNDVLSGRGEKLKLNDIPDPGWYTCTLDDERKALSRADVVIAITKEDQAFFESISTSKVVTIGHLISPQQKIKEPAKDNQILYVSSGGDTNIRSLQYFLKDTYPKIIALLPNATITFAGKICAFIDKIEDSFNVLGVVEDIHSFYEGANVVINSDVFGTGLSIKTVTALAHGRPLVTTPQGARGIDSKVNLLKVAQSPTDFANAVADICSNQKLASKMSVAALDFTGAYYNEQLSQLRSILEL